MHTDEEKARLSVVRAGGSFTSPRNAIARLGPDGRVDSSFDSKSLFNGEVRNADLTLLYDSRRKQEARLCRRWVTILHQFDPNLRMRYNYPYRGAADGLTTWLRKRHPETHYLGIELEINQALVGSKGWPAFQRRVAESLRQLVPAAC